MLSSEGSRLARLILARHTLICRALETDARYDVLTLVECARDALLAQDATTDAAVSFSKRRRRLSSELRVLPALIHDVEGQIERAWRRLESVSPRLLD